MLVNDDFEGVGDGGVCRHGPGWSEGREGALEIFAAVHPDRSGFQLLRSLAHPGLKLAGYAREHLPGLVEVGVLAGQRNRGLARVLGAPTDRGHQPGPAGDRFEPGFGVGQTHEQTPPVVEECHRTRRQLATVQIVRGEAIPAPLILEIGRAHV